MAAKGNRTHGGYGTPEHSSWRAMRDRCLNPNHVGWADYGGRGIQVCPRWLLFEKFLEDMGARPPQHTLDRIDTNGNYEPGNCRWATAEVQGANKRATIRLTLNGRTQTVMEWAKETGLSAPVIRRRVRRGWSHQRTLTQNYQAKNRH